MEPRLIDKKRNSGGSFTLGGADGEKVVEMIVIDDRMIVVSTHGVYESQLADQIDPARTDISLPQVIQQQIIAYGSESPAIARTLLTAKELFNPSHLGQAFDKPRALALALKAAYDFAAMADIASAIKADQQRGVDALTKATIKDSLKLPTTPNLQSRAGNFLAHARGACVTLLAIADLFFPKTKANEPWRSVLEAGLSKYFAEHGGSKLFFDGLADLIATVNNWRNAYEHPDQSKGVIVFDFAILPGQKFTVPAIEIAHPQTPLPKTDLVPVMEHVLDVCSSAFDGLCALLCDANIKMFGPIECRIAQLPDGKHRNGIRYFYEMRFKEGTTLPKSSDV